MKILLSYASRVTTAVENEKDVADYIIKIMEHSCYTNVVDFLYHFKTQNVFLLNNVLLIAFSKNNNFADGVDFKKADVLKDKNIFDYFDYETVKKYVEQSIK